MSKQAAVEPVRLSTNCIVDGVFIRAGEALPFEREEDLPPNLKAVAAAGEAEFLPKPVRDIYAPQPPSRGGNVQWMDAEDALVAEMNAPLPEETSAALEAAHSGYIEKLKAQKAFGQAAADAVFERATQRETEVETQYFVKRGGEFGKVQNCQLKPGEPCFVKRPNGQYEVSGYTDSDCRPPDSEITL
jgi:hypothetical protein